MAAIRLGINGFGRIGRQVARIAAADPDIDLVAFNDLCDAKTNAHLFKYDSTYGRFPGTVELNGDEFIVDGDSVKMLSEREPKKLPWGDLGVDFVLESTGVFRNIEQCGWHIEAGARHVLLSAPAKGAMPTYVLGVNHLNWISDGKPGVLSNASCTTNCLAPVAKVLNDSFTIKHALMNTIHAYTNDQRILDMMHSDLRRSRSAAVNIIPTTTGAAKAVGLVIPKLQGKVDGFAMRVPVVTGSVVDLTSVVEKPTNVEEVNAKLMDASMTSLKGVLKATHDPLVSTDVIQDPHSSIADLGMTTVMDSTFVKTVSWYDNEWGYSNRCIDLIKFMAENG